MSEVSIAEPEGGLRFDATLSFSDPIKEVILEASKLRSSYPSTMAQYNGRVASATASAISLSSNKRARNIEAQELGIQTMSKVTPVPQSNGLGAMLLVSGLVIAFGGLLASSLAPSPLLGLLFPIGVTIWWLGSGLFKK